MGTHDSCPSKVKGSQSSLKEHLNGQDLPFLFKVLSVRTALSIQAHPDLSLAKQLHTADPKNYKDFNHKPEMAIALGEFEALCGFRRAHKMGQFAKKFEGFADLLGEENVNNLLYGDEGNEKGSIKGAFEKLMKSSKEEIIQSIKKMPTGDASDSDLNLFHSLNSQYPNDVGVFCVFFLNHFTLNSGEAVFLAANEPHAYLSGSCIECMATSDNVVRAGLTPKHRDVDVLCSMLTYNSFNGLEELLTKPQKLVDRPSAALYKSPVPEFSVLRMELNGLGAEDECKNGEQFGKSILICTEGSSTIKTIESAFELNFGSIIYLPANTSYTITNHSTNKTIIYQAFNPQ